MSKLSRVIFALPIALVVGLSYPVLAADQYPSRPITIVVPFPPGGANDLLARLAGEKMGQLLHEPVVIENKAGAGGNIGSRYVAKAAPDGYTILLGFSGTLGINPAMYRDLGYDPAKDLTPIGTIATAAAVLVVYPGLPIKTLEELITYAKENPDKLNYASSGTGTVVHVSTEMVLDAAGIQNQTYPISRNGSGGVGCIGRSRPAHHASYPVRGRHDQERTASSNRRDEQNPVTVVAKCSNDQ